MSSLSLKQTSPTIICESAAILDNPISLPEYRPRAIKTTKQAHRSNAYTSDGPIHISRMDTSPQYLTPKQFTSDRHEMIASTGYSSSDRHSKSSYSTTNTPHQHEISRIPIHPSMNHEHRSDPSIEINRLQRTRKQYNYSKGETKNTLSLTKPVLTRTHARTDTQLYGGPKPYFVKRKPFDADSPSVVTSPSPGSLHMTNTDGSYNNPFSRRKIHININKVQKEKTKRKKKSTKYLSIVPKKKYREERGHKMAKSMRNDRNNYYIADGGDDGYSCYSEGVLYV